jgi:ferredoxin
MGDIAIHVVDRDNSEQALIAPTDMGLSLMEFLKGNGYDIPATCGGMALCATCHVQVMRGYEKLGEITGDEYAMLDTLPNITDTSRLSCQIRLTSETDGITVRVIGDGF